MSTPSTTGPVRVRFAPSPTGFLHIGGVRTALFCWLYARRFGGQFLLRIEDTDLERSESRYTSDIMASMKWLGLTWDEEPLFQSKRLDIYKTKVEELIAKGHAYRCTCTEDEVEQMRQAAIGKGAKPMYDRRCRDKNHPSNPGKPFVVRAKVPLTGSIEFQDLIYGSVKVENVDIDDFVLIRSNGAPTYNFSVVVDDVESRMTHIIRGDDHINNTPKQLHLYQFFNYKLPHFAHLPMILGADKQKLSKRHGAVSANFYRGEGYLPETILNFLARLGWSHGDQEVFSVEELIQFFDFDHVQKSAAVFNTEKLNWLNGVHLRQAKPERLVQLVAEDYADYYSPDALNRLKTDIGVKLMSYVQQKVKLLKEAADQLVPLCTPGTLMVDSALVNWGKSPNGKPAIQAAVKHFVTDFGKKMEGKIGPRTGANTAWGTVSSALDIGLTPTDVEATVKQLCEQHGIKLGEFASPVRVALTGRAVAPSVFDLIAVLPWDIVSARLQLVEKF